MLMVQVEVSMHGCCRLVQIPAERVEALLLWEEPYASAKVFGGGLYVLICLRHLVCGARPSLSFMNRTATLRRVHSLLVLRKAL